jgi:hypothetical protein
MPRLLFFLIGILLSCSVIAQTITGDKSLCGGGVAKLAVDSTANSYLWQYSTDGDNAWKNAEGDSTHQTYIATQKGFYRVITMPNSDTSKVFEVVDSPKPITTFTFDKDNVCSGTSIKFMSSVTAGTAPFTNGWSLGDSTTSTAQSPTKALTFLGCGTK